MTVAIRHHTQEQERNTVREPAAVLKQLPRRKLPLSIKHHQRDRSCVVFTDQRPRTKSSLLGHLKTNYSRRGPRRSHQVPRIGMAEACRHTIDMCSDDDSSSDDWSSARDGDRHVQFAKCCTVVEIPHFREYTPEQRELLWNGRKQIRTMARRNALEYKYDGWNVETASEEDQFVVVKGEHVHPFHAPVLEEQSTTTTTNTTTTIQLATDDS